MTYSDPMRQSTVTAPDIGIDPAPFARAKLAASRYNASDVARRFGGAKSYWTRRLSGESPMSYSDLVCVAVMVGCHPAELVGGTAPEGWTPDPSVITVTRQSHAPHNSPAVSTERLPIQRLRSVDFIPSQQAA